ncbi:MAG: photosystem I reaction center subunit XI [Leptolyngbyaceae cyanobacterium MAG.088]|nr:photosystem I reaction center subunit XI [Leptolyngbyaceae cyanobacterium MAG.088]
MATSFASATGAPEVGNVATPINSSAVARTYINNLPAYRAGLSPFSRGLEVGVAHGYWFYGPFAILGPLRATDYAAVAGVIAAVSFVFILTIALSIYSAAGPDGPEGTLTTPNPPEAFSTREGWSNFASGFLVGGCSGAFFAYLLCQTPHLLPLQEVAGGIWSS